MNSSNSSREGQMEDQGKERMQENTNSLEIGEGSSAHSLSDLRMEVYYAAILLSISTAYDPAPIITPLKEVAPGDAIPFQAALQKVVSLTGRRSGGRRKRTNFHFIPLGRIYRLNVKVINEQYLYSGIKARRSYHFGFMGAGYGSRCTQLNNKGSRCSQVTKAGFSMCDYHIRRQEIPRLMAPASANIEDIPCKGAPKREETKKKVSQKRRFIKELYADTIPTSFP